MYRQFCLTFCGYAKLPIKGNLGECKRTEYPLLYNEIERFLLHSCCSNISSNAGDNPYVNSEAVVPKEELTFGTLVEKDTELYELINPFG